MAVLPLVDELPLDALVAAAGGDRIVRLERFPHRPARTASTARPLPTAVAERVPASLWSHQAEAIDIARDGRS
ncbi:MAG: hypothetical protein L0221_04315, partial [Chloroflexi bacterium]|nr:hypothetical protein [Chloroflexota bacterium]